MTALIASQHRASLKTAGTDHPLFPASDLATGSFYDLHPKSQFQGISTCIDYGGDDSAHLMKIRATLMLGAALAALSATASAAVMTYTKTGFLSGSLGGTSFTNAAVTIRTTADTANVQYQFIDGAEGGTSVWTNAGVTSIDIDGFATATFNGSSVFGVRGVRLTEEMRFANDT
jgi:hypothetical protein